MIRKTFFWLHLAAGVLAGLVILIMSVTGVLLAFEKQVIAYAERDLRATAAEAARAPLPLSQIVTAASATVQDGKPSNVIIRSDKLAPVTVAFGREKTLFVNRYTGKVLGEGATGVRKFFEVNTALHRWLAMKGEARDRGKAITGASNLAFLFIVLSGLILWFPRRLSRKTFRAATLFRGGLRGKAREFSWHHVFGIWSFVPLVLIVFSGAVISYPWMTRLVYLAFGSKPPQQQQQQQQPQAGGERAGGERGERRGGGERAGGGERGERGGGRKLDLGLLDRLATAATTEAARVAPDWKSVSVRLPIATDGPATIALDRGNGTRPDKRSQLMMDPTTAKVVEHKTYAKQEAGQKARSWLRFIHTGEAGGILGQIIAMLASAAAVMLVYTGIALTLRRFARFLRGKPAPTQQLVEEESV